MQADASKYDREIYLKMLELERDIKLLQEQNIALNKTVGEKDVVI